MACKRVKNKDGTYRVVHDSGKVAAKSVSLPAANKLMDKIHAAEKKYGKKGY